MNTFEISWQKLESSKKYREEFAIALLKRMVPFQTRAIRKKREWSQTQLAEEAGLTQGVISRAEDPDYGNLTLNTIGRIAAGFDLAFIGKFVPFSELVKFSATLTEDQFENLRKFEDESALGFSQLFPTSSTELKKPAAREIRALPEIARAALGDELEMFKPNVSYPHSSAMKEFGNSPRKEFQDDLQVSRVS